MGDFHRMTKLRLQSALIILLFSTSLLAQSSPATSSSAAQAPAASSSTPQTPAPPAHVGPYPPMSAAAVARTHKIFEMFQSGQSSAIWASFAEVQKKRIGSEARFAAILKNLNTHLGTEKKMLEENTTPYMMSSGTVYSRRSEFNKSDNNVVTTIGLNENGQIDLLLVLPERVAPEGRFAGYKDKNKYKLPFGGQWLVDQGGHTVFQNAYMQAEEQRFGLDFTPLKDNRPFGGDGSKNEDYYCFGQPILAPADGLVIRVENDYADNTPGKPSNDFPHGNQVLISHGNGEFSRIDHLKQNSIKPKKGDKVKQGDQIAECGNSGSSPAPHVHFQLQNTSGIPLPEPLPAQFVDYTADGKPVAVGEPIRGQIVGNTMGGSQAGASK
jgi:murein DD-endopeptidase MepM/ murein hydrolase activator NlpD